MKTVTLAAFPDRRSAIRKRNSFIRAQRTVDLVAERLFGETVTPPADEVYKVVKVESSLPSYLVVCVDPSIPEVTDEHYDQ